VENVFLTLGSKGSLLANHQVMYRMPAFTVDVKDTTAAGDVFNGALCVAMAEGLDWEESMYFASLAAAISVTRMGAQSSAPTREDVISYKR
jgi:ribokinase